MIGKNSCDGYVQKDNEVVQKHTFPRADPKEGLTTQSAFVLGII